MSTSIILAIIVTSLATFSSRVLGVISSEGIKETSKLFRWFNCLAYSTLAALIARTIIFPVGVLTEASYLSRLVVVIFCLFIFFERDVLANEYKLTQLGEKFDDPWSLAFISEDKFLLAELTGELKVVNYTTGEVEALVSNVPEVVSVSYTHLTLPTKA